jgi:hypothetical protein
VAPYAGWIKSTLAFASCMSCERCTKLDCDSLVLTQIQNLNKLTNFRYSLGVLARIARDTHECLSVSPSHSACSSKGRSTCVYFPNIASSLNGGRRESCQSGLNWTQPQHQAFRSWSRLHGLERRLHPMDSINTREKQMPTKLKQTSNWLGNAVVRHAGCGNVNCKLRVTGTIGI